MTSTSTYPPLLALGAAFRATDAGAVRFFLGFFFFGFDGDGVSLFAVTGAVSGALLAAVFLLNDGKPNQPPDCCGGSFAGFGGALGAEAVASAAFGAGAGFGVDAAFGGGVGFVTGSTASSEALPLVSELVSPSLAVDGNESSELEALSSVGVVDAVGALLLSVAGADVDGVDVAEVAEVLAAGAFLSGEAEGLTLVIIQVAMPMPAKTKTVAAIPAITIPAPPFFGAAWGRPEPSSGAFWSTNVGRRLRFFPALGGVDRSLPVETERLVAFAVGDAMSVPAGDDGFGTPGDKLGAAPPVFIVISESGNIFPKSTGDDEAALVQGTSGPGAEGEPDCGAAGEPGKTGEIRELEVVGEGGGGIGGGCSGGLSGVPNAPNLCSGTDGASGAPPGGVAKPGPPKACGEPDASCGEPNEFDGAPNEFAPCGAPNDPDPCGAPNPEPWGAPNPPDPCDAP